MDNLLEQISSQPLAFFIVLCAGLVVLMIYLYRLLSIRNRIRSEISECAETHPGFQSHYNFSIPPRVYAAHFNLVEKLSVRFGLNLPALTHIDDFWIEQFEHKATAKLLDRLLRYSPEKALFPCFRTGLESESIFTRLRTWIMKSGELMIMRSIARSCNGRLFDGQKAFELTGEWREELYEMTGDPLWQSRMFSLQILLYDQSDRAERAVWEAFGDSSYRIRKLIAEEFFHQDSQKLYAHLQDLMLNDPVYEVRVSARKRIEKDFLSFYAIPVSLTHIQKLHLTEQLNPDIQLDREFAFALLDSEKEELMLEASRVLTKSGSLRRLFQQVFFEDKDSLQRTLQLLTNAAKVHCTSFLDTIGESANPGTLLVAAKLLREYGDKKHITTLVHQVRSFDRFQKEREPLHSIYMSALETACLRGDDNALSLVRDELATCRDNKVLQTRILPQLPHDHAHVFINTLFSFLKDRDYPARSTLRATIAALKPDLTLPSLFEIVKSEEETTDTAIQEQALRILCEIGIPYTIQHVLEHLPLLSVQRAADYSTLLADHFSKNYQERVKGLLKSTDARLRSRLISSIPADFHEYFKKDIRRAVQDSDPEVRSACAWTLIAHGDADDRKSCIALLHDPVEEVRKNSARAFAEHGGPEFFTELRNILEDSNEMIPVKTSIINGLSHSIQKESVDILVELIIHGGELQEAALVALSQKHHNHMILRILSHIRKADPENRALLVETIRTMGEAAESVLEAALLDAADSLKKVAVEVLESIGSIDSQIRHLSNRDPSVRKNAAAFLYNAGTLNAYRGLIQAARDPDEEVRTYVVKALDELNSDKGKRILEELKNDPQKKVRMYTAWALERYQARRL